MIEIDTTYPKQKTPHGAGTHPVGSRDPLRRLSNWMLGIWLGGLLAFGRVFAAIGTPPVYVPDLLLAVGLLLSVRRWGHNLFHQKLQILWLMAPLLAVLVAQSVERGLGAGYPAALKSSVMGIYPLTAIPLAALLIRDRYLFNTVIGRLLPMAAIGTLSLIVAGTPPIPAAAALGLAYGAAFAAAPGLSSRKLLGSVTLIGAGGLLATSPSRGALLSVLVGALASWIAGRPLIRITAKGLLTVCATGIFLSTSILVMVITNFPLRNLPLVGHVLSRSLNTANSGSQPANNVDLRYMMWKYALETTSQRHPWIGQGAGHYVNVMFASNDLFGINTGVHNSFIGYAFYAGFPAAIVSIIIFSAALIRAWRARAISQYAPGIFGCLSAALTICLTNVALETPYIGALVWAAVAAGFSMPRRVESSKLASHQVHAVEGPPYRHHGRDRTLLVPAGTRAK